MDNSKEKIAKEIAKTNDSIRKKYRALKTGRGLWRDYGGGHALDKHFKPIIDLLKQIVENIVKFSKDPIMTETLFSGEDKEPKLKRKRSSFSLYNNPIQASRSVKSMLNQSKNLADKPLVTSIRHLLQTPEGQKKLHANYGPFGQKYLKVVLSGNKAINIDIVYGIYFSEETMLGVKRITLRKNNDIIIKGKRYEHQRAGKPRSAAGTGGGSRPEVDRAGGGDED
ncbi:hypothetical protein G5I_07437 [Acromyrmex echinatior]|uniref:Uncharacterized protein n=1 Tax=Acromyrmex echinatior TaxID=103372 RepID=F4WNT2_ACREC|nr:hypothetical protein G5I_07437 [Acromyrmex echinatior]